jgi:hypothetical protein
VVVTLNHARYSISCRFEWSEVRFPQSFAFVTRYCVSIIVGAVNKTRNLRINVTLRRVRVTIVAVQKQEALHILSVCL